MKITNKFRTQTFGYTDVGAIFTSPKNLKGRGGEDTYYLKIHATEHNINCIDLTDNIPCTFEKEYIVNVVPAELVIG